MDFYSRAPNPRVSLLREDLLILLMILICVGGAIVLSGCGGPSAEEVTAEAVRVAHDKKITFIMPLEYTATVTQCNTTDGCKKRHYHPRTQ